MASGVSDLFEPREDGKTENEYEDLKDAPNLRAWTVQNIFKKYTYWTRQPKPVASDKHAKWLEWTTLIAPTLHAPLRPEDLTKPLKYSLITPKLDSTTTEASETSTIDDSLPERSNAKRKAPDSDHIEAEEHNTKKPLLEEIK